MNISHRTLAVFIVIVLLLSACQPILPPTPDSTAALPPEPNSNPAIALAKEWSASHTEDEIASQALAGNLLGDPATRVFFVVLPPSYETSEKRYPVVYVLHWYSGGPRDALRIVVPYRTLLRAGEAQEMILVFPDSNNRFLGSMYLSSPTIGDYETYIAKELVEYVDSHYRTIPHKDSRGITGCSMGGDGAIHLALKFPDVFSIAVPMSATYDYTNDPAIPDGAASVTKVPDSFRGLWPLNTVALSYVAVAAGAAPNSNAPPFYLDFPFQVEGGEGQIVPEVWRKIASVDAVHDVERYLAQPERLRAVLLIHGSRDDLAAVQLAREFEQLLTDREIEHEYLELEAGHCDFSEKPALQFLSDHLVAE